MKSFVKIQYHQVFGLGRAISGLCSRDGEDFWFEWDEINKLYVAYHLTEEDLVRLEEFRKELEVVLGKLMYHDERFEFSFPEVEGKEAVATMNSFYFPNPVKAFTFLSEEVINPLPPQ